MKKFMNSRRQKLTAICLLVGLLVLSTSVYANLDSANGYGNYKDAVKNLAFYTDNVSLEGEIVFELDGEEIFGGEMAYKVNEDGKNEYQREWEKGGYEYETYSYYHDGKQYRYYPDDDEYYVWNYNWDSYGYAENLLGIDTKDKTFNKAVRFIELGADLLIGDLKNNVVLLSNENGVKEYAVDVSQSQMPEIVNAGLSLIFTSYSGDLTERNYVTYEDWMKCYESYFIEHGGENAEELFKLWHYAEEADLEAAGYADWDEFYQVNEEKYDEITFEFDQYYEDMFRDEYDRKGVLYVNSDGSVIHYDSYRDYLFRDGNAPEYWYYLFGEDPYVSNAKMTVKLNEKGELIENYIEGTLTGFDEGEKHEAKLKIRLNASDYNETEIEYFDTEGKEQRN
ncbi:MAG: hypothetical protein IJP24_02040 [Firmicutes bacterium]|nr:hypothetical protein [Bacillota bacterium]MBQ9972278.1 hypothetical protein [Bacillota bacterium]